MKFILVLIGVMLILWNWDTFFATKEFSYNLNFQDKHIKEIDFDIPDRRYRTTIEPISKDTLMYSSSMGALSTAYWGQKIDFKPRYSKLGINVPSITINRNKYEGNTFLLGFYLLVGPAATIPEIENILSSKRERILYEFRDYSRENSQSFVPEINDTINIQRLKKDDELLLILKIRDDWNDTEINFLISDIFTGKVIQLL